MERNKPQLRGVDSEEDSAKATPAAKASLEGKLTLEQLREEVARATTVNIVPLIERMKDQYKGEDLQKQIRENLLAVYRGDSRVNETMINQAVEEYFAQTSLYSTMAKRVGQMLRRVKAQVSEKFTSKLVPASVLAGLASAIVGGLGYANYLHERLRAADLAVITRYADENKNGEILQEEKKRFYAKFAKEHDFYMMEGEEIRLEFAGDHRLPVFCHNGGSQVTTRELTELFEEYRKSK